MKYEDNIDNSFLIGYEMKIMLEHQHQSVYSFLK